MKGSIDRALCDAEVESALQSLPPLPQLLTNQLTPPALSNTSQSLSVCISQAVAIAIAPTSTDWWLYHRYCAARNTMGSSQSGLQIALVVLRLVKQIKVERCSYDSDDEFDYADYF